MSMRFERKESHEGFEYTYSILSPTASTEHEICARVVFDLGEVVEERTYTLKQKQFESLSGPVELVVRLVQRAIDEFKTQRGGQSDGKNPD